MARELVVYCDLCLRDDSRQEPGHVVTFTLDQSERTGLDVCDHHHKELFGPLRDILDSDIGVPADRIDPQRTPAARKRRQDKPAALGLHFQCTACDTSYTTLQPLGQHWKHAHNYAPDVTASEFHFGTACPLCGEDTGRELGRFHCLSAHPDIRGGAAGVFRQAEIAGDPHKIVKTQYANTRKILIRASRES